MHPLIQLIALFVLMLYMGGNLWFQVPPAELVKIFLPLVGVFVGMGILFYALARWWGWHELVRLFPDGDVGDARIQRYQSIAFGNFSGYNGIVHIQSGIPGVRFSMPFPFSVSNPPFLIPWKGIRGIERYRGLFGLERVKLLLHRTNVVIHVSASLAKEILREMPKEMLEKDSLEHDDKVNNSDNCNTDMEA